MITPPALPESAPAPPRPPKPSWRTMINESLFHPQSEQAVTRRHSLALIALLVAADILLWDHFGGVGFGLVALIVIFGLVGLRPRALRTREVYLFLVYGALLALRCMWDFTFGPAAMLFLLIPVLAVYCATPLRHLLDAATLGLGAYVTGGFLLLLHLAKLSKYVKRAASNPGGKAASCLGLIIPVSAALIIMLVFGAIFTLANPVIAHRLDQLIEHLSEFIDLIFTLVPSIGHIFFWAIVAWLVAGIINPPCPEKLANFLTGLNEAQSPQASHGSPVEAAAALAALITANVMFFFYNCVDIFYLWLNTTLPAGISYYDYCHRGTGWLTFTLLLSTLIIGVATSFRLAFHPRSRTIRFWSYVWAAQNFVIGLDVLRRLQFYISYNGLTQLRITGIIGTLLVICAVAIMVVKVRQRRNIIWLLRRYSAAFIVFLVILAVFPDGYAVARFNVFQSLSGNDRALVWMLQGHDERSAEGIPPLLPLLNHPNPVVARGTFIYICQQYQGLLDNREKHFAERDLAASHALRVLERYAQEHAVSFKRDSVWYDSYRDGDWQAFSVYVGQWWD